MLEASFDPDSSEGLDGSAEKGDWLADTTGLRTDGWSLFQEAEITALVLVYA